MVALILEVALLCASAAYLVVWRRAVRRRNSRTWDSLIAELRSDWTARDLSDRFLWREGLDATPDDAWQRMEGARGLCVMYQNARVMNEMADYAAKHCEGVDRLLIENLHSDALQIRVCVLMALCQYAFTQASDGVRINAYRAADLYTGMAARTTQMLQNYAAGMVPDFVAAM
jgi:hypothetical protein